MDDKLQFKISSALKDLVGKDLITSDNIAIFELVKNSYDAYADHVVITFANDKMKKMSEIKQCKNCKKKKAGFSDLQG